MISGNGTAIKGMLVYEDEFYVSLETGDGARHTFDRRQVKIDIHDPLAAHVSLLNQYTDDDIHNLLAYLETLK